MATTEGNIPFSVASVVEDVLQQYGKRLSDNDLASWKAEEAPLRRYEAAGWLRKMVGVVGSKDLPAQPSEEEFRLSLRSGIILCSVLNKVQPGAVPKVVEAPSVYVVVPDGGSLSAYQYFENVRNFLVAVEEMGLPTFEASDLEKGGKSSRIVNCVLALKSYSDWKQGGGNGLWKYGGNLKPTTPGEHFVPKNSELFMSSLKKLTSEKSLDSFPSEQFSCSDLVNGLNEMGNSHSFHMLVRELLLDKKSEEIPIIVENMLGKVMEEFEHRLASQNEQMITALKDVEVSKPNKSLQKCSTEEMKMEDEVTTKIVKEEYWDKENFDDEGSKGLVLKRQMLVERQHRDIQELKHTLHTAKVDLQFFQMKYQEEIKNLGRHLHGLADAASGYHKVLEENRKLYNQVQDLKGSIRVYCRVRPFLPGQPNCVSVVDRIDEENITIIMPSKNGKDGRKSFTFNKVFGPSATQEELFSETKPLIRSVLDGYSVCIFAYGQTGSGKTYTMTGCLELTQENLGIVYRALRDLFIISEQRKATISYEVSIQMIEIYNEQVRDLLVIDGLNKRLEIHNSGQKGLNLPDANAVPVSSMSDVINLMEVGHNNRAVGATAIYDRSNRSHSCLTIHVQGRELATGKISHGCMHLVELAGSERVDKSEVVGDRLKETQHINKSLSALGDVISSLGQKNSHVPYRNSKLTQFLQASLGGQAKTLMFVHISPELDAVGETISTLKFAERVSTVEHGSAQINKDSTEVKELKQQIARLKAALARKEGEVELQQQPMEYVSSLEVSNNTSKLERQSLDLQDSSINSPSLLPVGSPSLKEGKRDAASGDWVDKVVINKQDSLGGDESLSRCWEHDSGQLAEMFYERCSANPSKIYPESYKFSANSKDSEGDLHTNGYETATTADFDDTEAATSDSSETDVLWQLNLPKVTRIPNALGSKINRPNPKQMKNLGIRSSIPPRPTRRLSYGLQLHRTERQPVPVDGKRKSGSGK